MDRNFEVREAEPGDTEAILDLMRRSLGEGSVPRSREYWNWKHQAGPFGPSPCLIASSGGTLVGLRVFMRWTWRVGMRTSVAVRAVDTATHPEWRGRGIFSQLTRQLLSKVAADGAEFVFNTPNEKSRPGYLKMGWQDVGRLSLWVRPVGLWKRGRSFFERSRAADDDDALEGTGASIGDFLAESSAEDFLASLSYPHDKLLTPRTTRYIKWRYSDIPGFRYRVLYDLAGPTSAAVIFRIRSGPRFRELRLCDVLAPEGAGRQASRLVRRVLAGAGSGVAVALAGGVSWRVMSRGGFVPAPLVGPRLTARMIGTTTAVSPLKRSNWRMSIGDVELF